MRRSPARAPRLVGLAAGLALVAQAVGPAYAQPKKPAPAAPGGKPEERAIKDAQARFEEGLRRYKAQDFEGARLAFLQAYTAYPSVDILWNLCLAELRAGKTLDALKHLRQYEKDPKLTDAERAKAQKYVEEAKAKTGHARVRAPEGAEIKVDGAVVGEAPLAEDVDVDPGNHVFEARQGAEIERQEVAIEAGQSLTVQFAPKKAAAPAPPVEEKPSPWKTPEPEGPGAGRTVTALALGGAGVVAIGVGVALRLSASDAASDAESLRQGNASSCVNDRSDRCAQLADAADSSVTQGNVSNVLLVGGGVLVAGAVVTWLVWPSGKASQAGAAPGPSLRAGGVELSPVLSPTSAGLVGRF